MSRSVANATKIGAINDGTFDTRKYAAHYCMRDVDVLAECFEAIREMFLKRFNVDVYRFLSMPGLAYAIQLNEGCFDEVYSMRGVPLAFVREAIVGGRFMTRDNKKYHTTHQIVDFDAVSLYPSAMSRLDGYPKDMPKLFKDYLPEKSDYYIARVKFTSISIKRHFPLLSVKGEGDTRDFTNDIVGKTMVLGKQALEDIVEFQGATYEIIEGIYWDQGFNTKICSTIKELFNERLVLKKQGNPLQEGIKLLMNSSYGKLIQKPILSQKAFVVDTKYKQSGLIEEYTRKNINRLISRTMVTPKVALFEEHQAVIDHWSPAHLGVMVLDMSKRIMNEVMCLAEDIGAPIWYQDTDSMHIDRDALCRLTEAFQAKYGRELVGTGLGQFHSDFSLPGSEGEVYAKESIFLGKKHTSTCLPAMVMM